VGRVVFFMDEAEMRFQHVVVVGLGWLLAVVVGCTSGESTRISGLSNFVPSFVFDSKVESPEITKQAEMAEPSEVAEQSKSAGKSFEDLQDRTRASLHGILPKLSWKRQPSEHAPDLDGPDVTAVLTEKERAAPGGSGQSRVASLKSRFRIGKPRISKAAGFRARSIPANEVAADEFRSIDAELEGLYATDSGSAARGLDALLADADAMSELDSFGNDSAEEKMIVLRATPDVSAFQPSDENSQASLNLIQLRDRGFKVSDDVAIRSLPFVTGDQESPAIEPVKGLPASSLSWREQLQKYPVTQDQKSNSVATLIQPKQTELRVLRMTAVTPEDRSVRVAPKVSIRSVGSPTVVRRVHPAVSPGGHTTPANLADPHSSNRRVYSTGQYSQEKTLNR